MPYYRANSEAEVRGQAPLSNEDPDAGIVTNVRDPQHPTPLHAPDPDGIDSGDADGRKNWIYSGFRCIGPTPRPVAWLQEAWTHRPFDQWAAYLMNGLHGVIPFSTPADQMGTTGDRYGDPVWAARPVFRPVPQQWDAPYGTVT